MEQRVRITLGIEAAINLAINGFLNGLCAWLLFRGLPAVPVGFWSLLVDTTITCFLVSIFTACFCTASARRYRAQGLRIDVDSAAKRFLSSLPQVGYLLGCCLFGMCLPPLAIALGMAFSLAGIEAIPLEQFVAFKAAWAGIYGTMVCVITLLRNLVKEHGEVL